MIPLPIASPVHANKEQIVAARNCYRSFQVSRSVSYLLQTFYIFITINSLSITQLAGPDVSVNAVVKSKTRAKSNVHYHTYSAPVDIVLHLDIVEWIVVCSGFVFCCFLTCCSSHSVIFCRNCYSQLDLVIQSVDLLLLNQVDHKDSNDFNHQTCDDDSCNVSTRDFPFPAAVWLAVTSSLVMPVFPRSRRTWPSGSESQTREI